MLIEHTQILYFGCDFSHRHFFYCFHWTVMSYPASVMLLWSRASRYEQLAVIIIWCGIYVQSHDYIPIYCTCTGILYECMHGFVGRSLDTLWFAGPHSSSHPLAVFQGGLLPAMWAPPLSISHWLSQKYWPVNQRKEEREVDSEWALYWHPSVWTCC